MKCVLCNKEEQDVSKSCEKCYIKYKPYIKNIIDDIGWTYLKRLINERKYCEQHKTFYITECRVCAKSIKKKRQYYRKCSICGEIGRAKICHKCKLTL